MARTLMGTVSSSKGDKTIVITVTTRQTHPIYKKQYTVSTRFMAHDENNEAKLGDRVTIIETRPLSARKRFRLSKILEKAGAGFEEADAIADVPPEQIEPKAEVEASEEKPAKDEPKVTKEKKAPKEEAER